MVDKFYVWVREGDFWHRKEVSSEEYFSRASDSKGRTMGNVYEEVGPVLQRGDGTKYREQQLK